MHSAVHRLTVLGFGAGVALVLLALPGCPSGGDNNLVSLANDYYRALQSCGILSEGRLPTVDAEDVNDVPPEYRSYYVCMSKCVNSGSCEDLYDMVCNDSDALYVQCSVSCPRPTWTCANGEEIDLYSHCDGEADCVDGSDEEGCPADQVFTCDSGETVPADYRCDDYEDCADGSDEAGCPPPATFTCSSGETVLEYLRCDGEADCADGSDEAGCPHEDEFTCGSGETVPADWVCDAEPDCQDGSDEAGCAQYTCSP